MGKTTLFLFYPALLVTSYYSYSDFKDYDVYINEDYNEDGMLPLLNYREDGTTPYFTYFAAGVKGVKC